MARKERRKGKRKDFFFPFVHLIAGHYQKDSRKKDLDDKTASWKSLNEEKIFEIACYNEILEFVFCFFMLPFYE